MHWIIRNHEEKNTWSKWCIALHCALLGHEHRPHEGKNNNNNLTRNWTMFCYTIRFIYVHVAQIWYASYGLCHHEPYRCMEENKAIKNKAKDQKSQNRGNKEQRNQCAHKRRPCINGKTNTRLYDQQRNAHTRNYEDFRDRKIFVHLVGNVARRCDDSGWQWTSRQAVWWGWPERKAQQMEGRWGWIDLRIVCLIWTCSGTQKTESLWWEADAWGSAGLKWPPIEYTLPALLSHIVKLLHAASEKQLIQIPVISADFSRWNWATIDWSSAIWLMLWWKPKFCAPEKKLQCQTNCEHIQVISEDLSNQIMETL